MCLQNISNQVSNSYIAFYTYQTFHKTKYMLPLNMKQLMTFLLTKMLSELGSITFEKQKCPMFKAPQAQLERNILDLLYLYKNKKVLKLY